jgi:predicted DNA-binding transcriptional regulator AlpA
MPDELLGSTALVALNATARERRFHLDRRAHELIEDGAGDPDALLTTSELCEWLGVSTQWAEIARHKGIGPRHISLSTRRIRYRRSDVLSWLAERTRQSTREPVDAA